MSTLVETLASYVPALVARRFIDTPSQITSPGADSFPAAILFADISGFTAQTERLAQHGPAGAEEMSRLLNAYFGQLIDLVTAHGGDILKFAGDALLAVWPAIDESLDTVARRAAQCGLAVQATLHAYTVAEDVRLSLRVGIGAGEIFIVHIGGVRGRWEFLTAGAPLVQLGNIKQDAQPGDVIISAEGWALVQAWFTGRDLPQDCMRLEAVREPLPLRALASPAPLAHDAALRAFIPTAILDRLAAGQTEWLAELRRVSVIFINLRELNHASPNALKQAQMVTRALQTLLYRYECSINKISVDDRGATLVAAAGLPPWAHEDDAARAVQAAFGAQATLRQLGLQPAIGIATGLVFCGSVGNTRRREYTMVGDVVNLSARLMQAAQDDVLCDAATVQAAQSQLSFEPLPAISVKGKAEPVALYRPQGQAKTTLRPQGAMIGRAAERAVLEEQLQALAGDGAGGALLIEGEAGIGKSRLVDELLQLAQALGVTCLSGAGDAIEKNTPYHAWQSIFTRLLGLDTLTDPETRRAHVLDQLQSEPELLRLSPLLNAVLPLDLPENETTVQLTGQLRADHTHDLLLHILAQFPVTEPNDRDTAPKVLTVEDAHWLDSASWALMLLAGQRVRRLLLVVATRPLADPPVEYQQLLFAPNTRRLRLEALPPDDTLALVCQRLGVDVLPQPVIDLIAEKAEGHPFFSEELAYALRDAGLIRVVAGQCALAPDAGDLRALSFPDTIQGVITSRIDRLTPPQQMTVKAASVIGRTFPYRILRDIHPIEIDKPHLADYLATLQQLNLTLLDTPEPDLAYIFKHAITQEVAYNLMLFAQRRQLHHAVAQWYERAQADDGTHYYQLLAYHWNKAGDESKAIDYLEKAGRQAMHTGANAEAKALFEQALELLLNLSVTPQRQRQLVELAVNLARVGAYLPSDNILEMLQRAKDAAEALQDEALLARAYGGAGAFHYVMGRISEALNDFGKCMALAERLGLEELLMQPYNIIGRTLAVTGDYAKAAAMLAKGIPLAEKFHDLELLSGSLLFYASTFWFQGRRAEGVPHAERGLALAEQIGLPSRIAGNLMVMGFCQAFCGFFEAATHYLEYCLRIAEEKQFIQPLYIAHGCLGYLHLHWGNIDTARDHLGRCLQLAEDNKASAFVPLYQAYRAELDLINGDWPAALARAEAASAAAERTQQRMAQGEAQRILGKIHARADTPDWDKAEQALKNSLALQQKYNARPLVAVSTFELGQLYRDRGQTDQARAMLDEAMQLFESLEMAWHLAQARRVSAAL
ncbi:MAG TPA: adenylate/guanylate cyclase domain-containing protein [Anaerolineae bacterium]|nr:adenylate/guanylate cyclase domain-containing protein [Anaerolineae bacterium]